jgi:hemolysin III
VIEAEDAIGRAEQGYEALAERVEHRVSDAIERLPEADKPRLRGWLHLGAIPVALIATLVLLVVADSTAAETSAAVFGFTSVLLFSGSAVYHVGRWSPSMTALLRRVDHANIFLIIAGTYTPLVTLLLGGTQRTVLLTLIWTLAIAGAVFRVAWVAAPRWLYVGAYVALGWTAVFFMGDLVAAGEPLSLTLIALGGVAYTVGGVVYGTKRPDPSPRWFGYHEVFHSLTLVGWVCHYVAVLLLVIHAG